MEKRKTSGKVAKVSEARVAIIERLRNTPADKLSKTAKWLLKKEDSGEKYWMDTRAVMK